MSHYNVPIKVGEIVTIKDGSYMVAIDVVENRLTRRPTMEEFGGNLVTLKHKYVVIAVNVPCPQNEDILKSLHPANNCIIKDLSNNIIWFCSTVNLKTKRNLLK
jgi:hypothetical protein